MASSSGICTALPQHISITAFGSSLSATHGDPARRVPCGHMRETGRAEPWASGVEREAPAHPTERLWED